MENSKIITFLLPRTGENPIGGFKVIYEYGNRLIERGCIVNYVYGIVSRKDIKGFLAVGYKILRFFRYLKYKYFKSFKSDSWFKTDKRSNHILAYSLSEINIPQSDVVIASSWATAYWLNDYKKIKQEQKYYFIQHFEDWHGGYDKVIRTWKMNLQKIVIAPWLQKMASEIGEKSILIENGFNLEEFHLTNPIDTRNEPIAIMLWHDNPFKGCRVGLDALNIVKKQIPNFNAILFGVPNKPENLPNWITYYQKPEISLLRNLYNKSAIFVGSSFSEGWGLTIGEAMLCGCAVACTNNDGYMILAKDNDTALLSEIGNSSQLANNIIELLTNKDLRIKIAINGNLNSQNYTWNKSAEKFYKTIMSIDL